MGELLSPGQDFFHRGERLVGVPPARIAGHLPYRYPLVRLALIRHRPANWREFRPASAKHYFRLRTSMELDCPSLRPALCTNSNIVYDGADFG
jgi:hypothetical protein